MRMCFKISISAYCISSKNIFGSDGRHKTKSGMPYPTWYRSIPGRFRGNDQERSSRLGPYTLFQDSWKT